MSASLSLHHSPQFLASILCLPPLLSITCVLAAQRVVASKSETGCKAKTDSGSNGGHHTPASKHNHTTTAFSNSLLLAVGLQVFPLFAGSAAGILFLLTRSCPGPSVSYLVGVVGALASIPLLLFVTLGTSALNMPNNSTSTTSEAVVTSSPKDAVHHAETLNGLNHVSSPDGMSDRRPELTSLALETLQLQNKTTRNHPAAPPTPSSPFTPFAASEPPSAPKHTVTPATPYLSHSRSSSTQSQLLSPMPPADYLVLGATPTMPALTPGTTVASASPPGIMTPPHPPVTAEYLALEDEFVRLLLASAAKVKQENYAPEIPLAPWPKEWPVYWEGAGLGAW